MICVSIGRGHWLAKCNSSSYLLCFYSYTLSKFLLLFFYEWTENVHIFVFQSNRYPNAAKAIFCSLFGIFVAFLLSIAIFTKFTPAYDVMHSLGTDMYIAPWARILPYLIGVGSGYAMFTFNGVMPLGEVSLIMKICWKFTWFLAKSNLIVSFSLFPQKSIKIIWTVMITIAISSHVSTLNRDISHYVAAPLITFIRIFYPASISWMIIASQTGHGGTFAKILDCPIFVHVNKLSYAIYLLNPVVISTLYGWQDHSTHIDPISMVCILSFKIILTYMQWTDIFNYWYWIIC